MRLLFSDIQSYAETKGITITNPRQGKYEVWRTGKLSHIYTYSNLINVFRCVNSLARETKYAIRY